MLLFAYKSAPLSKRWHLPETATNQTLYSKYRVYSQHEGGYLVYSLAWSDHFFSLCHVEKKVNDKEKNAVWPQETKVFIFS